MEAPLGNQRLRTGPSHLGPWLVMAAVAGGVAAHVVGSPDWARLAWSAATAGVTLQVAVISVVRLRQGRVAVDVVALLALVGALVLDEPLAGAILAVMVASGDALERHAHRRARRSLAALVSRAPTLAHRQVGQELQTVPVEEVAAGEVVLVRPGEVVGVDGMALEAAVLDSSALTGEFRPVEIAAGGVVRSGALNVGGAFRLRAVSAAADSTYAGIVGMVSAAGVDRTPMVRMADRYALVFVPVVLVVAGAAWLATGDADRALAVLVVATPCPLVLAAPVAIVSGMATAARAGVVVKDGSALEALARARTVLLDKTGTVTAGAARVVAVVGDPDHDSAEVLRLAASLEQASTHVIAARLVEAASDRGLALAPPTAVVEEPGRGVEGVVEGHRVRVGAVPELDGRPAPGWLQAGRRRARREGHATVGVSLDGLLVAVILLADQVRVDTPAALRALRRAGVERIVLLSGDRLEVAEPVGYSLGVDHVYADRSPAEKLEVVRLEASSGKGTTVMVGDGINDAPALAAADVGVAMGARGATASSEAADVVVVVDRLDRVAAGVAIARRATAVAGQAVVLGMTLSFVGMAAAAAGWLPPVAGAVAQEGIDVLAITSALRALRSPTRPRPTVVPPDWTHQLAVGHEPLRLVLDEVRSAADRLDAVPPQDAFGLLNDVAHLVSTELVPHERMDESEIYPDVSRHLGGEDPLAAMSRTHQEIFHLASLLARLVSDCAPEGRIDAEDRTEARRILHALDAVGRLHFAQEEGLLASLTDV